jgi:predicted phage terminase large subunit-like protein
MGRPSDVDYKVQNVLYVAQLLRQKLAVQKCEDDFGAFVREAWKVIEPGTPFVDGWYIDAIAEHLQALYERDIRNLCINVSPRIGKSSICSVCFPAWIWLKNPAEKMIYSSYDLKLSMRDSRKTRMLIGSQWFQKNWGDKFKILMGKGGQDGKGRFDNDQGGHRIATSINAGTLGDGGDLLAFDDPNNIGLMGFDSDAHVENVINFYDLVMGSRLNNPKTGIRLLIQQRCAENDLTGHVLAEAGWDHLCIPMEYEGSKKMTSIGWQDPREKMGELMAPERFNEEWATVKKQNAIVWAGQYQQRPAPAEGNKFKREWFNYYNDSSVDVNPETGEYAPVALRVPGREVIYKRPVRIPAAFEQIIQSWDMTFKDERDNDFVAAHVWGRVGANFYLLHRDTKQRDFTSTVKVFRELSRQYPCPEKLVEDKANGPAVISTLKNEIPGIIPINPEGGKIARANAVAPYVEAGNVFLPNPDQHPWVNELIEQAANFPNAAHDDDVDAMSQALRRLADSISQSALPEFRVLPRSGEPDSACHVQDIQNSLQPQWRRWIAVAPGTTGAALWFCETPTGGLRVYRELDISGMDAHEAGRQIAAASLPDIRAVMRAIHSTAKWHVDVLLGKEAFVPIEPIGCYAELMEQGLFSYEHTFGSFDERQAIKAELRLAKFSTQMAEVEDAAFDRLRELMRFKPVDFETVPFDRTKAITLSRKDINKYNEYMAAVDGQVYGDWPKIKFASNLSGTVSALGTLTRDAEVLDPFLRALLIGICAPRSVMSSKPGKWVAYQPELRRAM